MTKKKIMEIWPFVCDIIGFLFLDASDHVNNDDFFLNHVNNNEIPIVMRTCVLK